MKEKWDQLLVAQKDPEGSPDGSQANESPCSGEVQLPMTHGADSNPPIPESNPAEAEPDPHANVGDPVPILKVVRRG